MKKRLANLLTGLRILCSGALMLFPAFSARFYLAYLLCGLSDMADGAVARKMNSASRFGGAAGHRRRPRVRGGCADEAAAAASSPALAVALDRRHRRREGRRSDMGRRPLEAAGVRAHGAEQADGAGAVPATPGAELCGHPVQRLLLRCAVASAAALQEGYEIARGREIV